IPGAFFLGEAMLKGLKGMLFEGEEKEKPKTEPAQVSFDGRPPDDIALQMELSQTARPDDGKFYTRLTAATDFFASEIGLKVKKYLDALSVIPDETLRLKTAISQAKKLD